MISPCGTQYKLTGLMHGTRGRVPILYYGLGSGGARVHELMITYSL